MLEARAGPRGPSLQSFLYVVPSWSHIIHLIIGRESYLNQVKFYDTVFYYVPLVDHWGSENPHQYFSFQASPELKQALLSERVACKSSEALASKIKFISTVSSISEAYSSLQLSPSGKFLENLMWNPHFGTSLGQRIDN